MNLSNLKVKELRDIIKKHNKGSGYVKGYYKLKKQDLIREVTKIKRRVSPKRVSPKRVSPKRVKGKPRVGDIVKVIIKPYDKNVTANGIVKRVLTKKEVHTRGHKVMLRDGTVGRLVKILKRK
tara:strand:- start:921 stop:1289 length:369 start_codon:yes stop_codon:yes gene_type:complete